MKDLYFILGTDRNCTPGELNAAYGKLARKFQSDEPDQFFDNHLREITEAYQVLSDPVRRRKYDVAFRKNYQRRLYYFKIRHINVAVTLTLIFFTGLFGYYVLKYTQARKEAKPVKTEVAAVIPTQAKHHKKKHGSKLRVAVAIAQHKMVADTLVVPVAKSVPAVKSAVTSPNDNWPIADDQSAPKSATPKTYASKPAITAPVAVASAQPSGYGYTTTLQANSTGWVYLHEEAGYRSNILTSVPNHAKVTVLEKGRDFYKINFNGQAGYVPRWTVADP